MTFKAKNKYGITHRQWMFAEEYLVHFNADEAYRKVYSSSQTRNAWVILKSRKLIEYIRMRMEEKQATLDRLCDLANRKLVDLMESGNNDEQLRASKIVFDYANKKQELEAKLKQLENDLDNSQQPQNRSISFQIITSEQKED